MINERYTDFMRFALQRIIELALVFEKEAKACHNSSNKLFLYYLAGKKRVQHVVLEMIAAGARNGQPLQLADFNTFTIPDTNSEALSLSDVSAEQIVHFAHSHAKKDYDLFISLASLEEDYQTKRLLSTLGRLSKEFMHDITEGYSKFFISEPDHVKSTAKDFRENVYENVCSV